MFTDFEHPMNKLFRELAMINVKKKSKEVSDVEKTSQESDDGRKAQQNSKVGQKRKYNKVKK